MTMFGKLGVTDLTFADNGREALGILKDSYAEKGFDGVLLKPANLDSLRKLLT